jgi:hypothetical protein
MPVKCDPHPSEFERFDATMKMLLAVPRDVLQKRLKEFKERPGTRGPKRKVKPPASPDPAA